MRKPTPLERGFYFCFCFVLRVGEYQVYRIYGRLGFVPRGGCPTAGTALADFCGLEALLRRELGRGMGLTGVMLW